MNAKARLNPSRLRSQTDEDIVLRLGKQVDISSAVCDARAGRGWRIGSGKSSLVKSGLMPSLRSGYGKGRIELACGAPASRR